MITKTIVVIAAIVAILGLMIGTTTVPYTQTAATQGGPPPGATQRFCPSDSTLERGECVVDKSPQCLGEDQVIEEMADENGVIHLVCIDPDTGDFMGEAIPGCPVGTTETSEGKCSYGRPGPR